MSRRLPNTDRGLWRFRTARWFRTGRRRTSLQVTPGVLIALQALSSNKLQTALTMTGITIGVATVLTMISLGSGAESAIEDQVRAAGMNMIIVTAGNYKNKTADDLGAIEEQARLDFDNAME